MRSPISPQLGSWITWVAKGLYRTICSDLLEKREAVYFYLIKRALALEKRVLYLVPEIAMTRGLLEKFRKRFGENAALLHSRILLREREEEWRKIRTGRAHVVLGPRLAVLSPVEGLGLVILDEEQDESYFQREESLI